MLSIADVLNSSRPPVSRVPSGPCSLPCILLVVYSKTSFFLRCFGPLGGKGFHLGDVKKHRFLPGFGLQEGPGAEKNAS